MKSKPMIRVHPSQRCVGIRVGPRNFFTRPVYSSRTRRGRIIAQGYSLIDELAVW